MSYLSCGKIQALSADCGPLGVGGDFIVDHVPRGTSNCLGSQRAIRDFFAFAEFNWMDLPLYSGIFIWV